MSDDGTTDPPAPRRPETLHADGRVRVRRVWSADGTGAAIRKEPLGPLPLDLACRYGGEEFAIVLRGAFHHGRTRAPKRQCRRR